MRVVSICVGLCCGFRVSLLWLLVCAGWFGGCCLGMLLVCQLACLFCFVNTCLLDLCCSVGYPCWCRVWVCLRWICDLRVVVWCNLVLVRLISYLDLCLVLVFCF